MSMNRLHDLLKPVTDALGEIEPELVDAMHKLTARLNAKLDEEEARLFAWVTTHLASKDAVVDEPTAETPDELAEQTDNDQAEQVATPTNEPIAGVGGVDGAQGVGTVGAGGDATPIDSGERIG